MTVILGVISHRSLFPTQSFISELLINQVVKYIMISTYYSSSHTEFMLSCEIVGQILKTFGIKIVRLKSLKQWNTHCLF